MDISLNKSFFKFVQKHVGSILVGVVIVLLLTAGWGERYYLISKKEGELAAKEKVLQQLEQELLNKKKELSKNMLKINAKLADLDSKAQIENRRTKLDELYQDYLDHYSQVNFSSPIPCDKEEVILRNQADVHLDAISALANSYPEEFKEYLGFVDRRKGFVVVLESGCDVTSEAS